jgi:hypothetical protein
MNEIAKPYSYWRETLMRWFKRKKKDTTEATPPKVPDETLIEESAAQSTLVSLTNPVHAFTKRLEGILEDPEMIEKTKALKDTKLQLIIGGESVLLSKTGVQPLGMTSERSTQTDVFIRISDTAAGQLAMTSTLEDFKKSYKQLIAAKDTTSFVSIKLHTPLSDLRAQGYFSVEFLRILIDA